MVAARWGSTHEACKSIGRAHQDDGRGRFCAANHAPFGTDPLLGTGLTWSRRTLPRAGTRTLTSDRCLGPSVNRNGLLPHLRLRLVQPEAHVHLAVHRRRRRQMLSGLVRLVGLPEELTQVEVAVGDERTHAEVAGQGQGLAIVAFRRLDSRRIATGDDFAEQAETPRLVAALLVALRQGHGLLCTLQSIVEPPLEQVCLTEPGEL